VAGRKLEHVATNACPGLDPGLRDFVENNMLQEKILLHTGDATEAFGSFFYRLAGANLDRRLYPADILEILRCAEPQLHAPGLGGFFPATTLPIEAPVQANPLVHWVLEHFVRGFRNYRRRCG
jgi:hypothetical protein